MRVKAVQIAREMGISKATVSLALNNKPGVNKNTKREILLCRERLENKAANERREASAPKKGIIKVIIATRGLRIALDSEMDLWTDVLAVFEQEAKKRRYLTGITYIDVRAESIDKLADACNGEDISGVVLQATELYEEDISKFEKIRHPMVIYDNESTDLIHNCVVADNFLGVERAVNWLFRRNYKDIIYLANDIEIYNFRQRRKGFCGAFLEHNQNPYQPGRIVEAGATIENVYHKMNRYLDFHGLPEAFIMENYQVTIGTMRALKERRIAVPEQVALIGIDALPSYMTGDCQLTAVRIPHTERAVLVIMLLEKEIAEQSGTKSRVMTDCRLMEGMSVKSKYNGK